MADDVKVELKALKKRLEDLKFAKKRWQLDKMEVDRRIESLREDYALEVNAAFPPPDPNAPKRGPKPKDVPAAAPVAEKPAKR